MITVVTSSNFYFRSYKMGTMEESSIMKKYAIRLLVSLMVGVASVGGAEAQSQCNGTLFPTGPIPGSIVIRQDQINRAQAAIAGLDYADIWRSRQTLVTVGDVRLDAQPSSSTHRNLQVQIGHRTIAALLVDDRFAGAANIPPLRNYVLRQVRNGLVRSLEDGFTRQLNLMDNCS
jgi:hypothetical protein